MSAKNVPNTRHSHPLSSNSKCYKMAKIRIWDQQGPQKRALLWMALSSRWPNFFFGQWVDSATHNNALFCGPWRSVIDILDMIITKKWALGCVILVLSKLKPHSPAAFCRAVCTRRWWRSSLWPRRACSWCGSCCPRGCWTPACWGFLRH